MSESLFLPSLAAARLYMRVRLLLEPARPVRRVHRRRRLLARPRCHHCLGVAGSGRPRGREPHGAGGHLGGGGVVEAVVLRAAGRLQGTLQARKDSVIRIDEEEYSALRGCVKLPPRRHPERAWRQDLCHILESNLHC